MLDGPRAALFCCSSRHSFLWIVTLGCFVNSKPPCKSAWLCLPCLPIPFNALYRFSNSVEPKLYTFALFLPQSGSYRRMGTQQGDIFGADLEVSVDIYHSVFPYTPPLFFSASFAFMAPAENRYEHGNEESGATTRWHAVADTVCSCLFQQER